MKTAWFYSTSIGRMGIAMQDCAITNIFFGNTVKPKIFTEQETDLLHRAAAQINEYLAGTRTMFDLPLTMEGTPFQQTVWNGLLHIPYGETTSYGALAQSIGKPKASRAVGRANALNPLSIVVPCHRVIGAQGSLTGYAGGLDLKSQLLNMEKARKR